MYGRQYGETELNFEPSGGLINASLVMQDKETDSYWAIMTGESIEGELTGTRLEGLPVGSKTQWGRWRAAHPESKVLSVDGVEHLDQDPYERYWSSEDGFRGIEASDDRLPTKAAVYTFHLDGTPFAVPFDAFEGEGGVFEAGGETILLYRPRSVHVFHSTVAFRDTGEGFAKKDGAWIHVASGARFDPKSGAFRGDGAGAVAALEGFDTFWYNWSLTNPGTEVLQ